MATGLPAFTIVTPSYQMLDGLKLCASSISDQEGVTIQHIIQDSCSTDAESVLPHLRTLESRSPNYQAELHIQKDSGIYQAVNRGFAKASHEILAYLNCDEQYLPGALQKVAQFFAANPKVDIVFGDLVFVNETGEAIHYQKTILPSPALIRVSYLPVFTCATFMRKKVFLDCAFREDLRDVSDAYWVLEQFKRGTRMGLLHSPTSTFTCSTGNSSLSDNAIAEKRALKQSAPWLERQFSGFVKWNHKLKKACQGCYQYGPFPYEIYRPGESARHTFAA